MQEIQHISITDAVVKNLRVLIKSGEYAAGDKFLTEAEICKSMNVSRTCVREALRVLQTMGYIELRPGRGAFVADYRIRNDSWYDVENAKFHDFMEVRQAIENLSVRLAVERADKSDIEKLKKIHNDFCAANDSKDSLKMIMLDEMFHTQIIECTNNQLLININKQLLESFQRYRNESFMNEEVYRNAVEPHKRILDCFKSGDSAQAVIEMKAHLDITAQDVETIHSQNKSIEELVPGD